MVSRSYFLWGAACVIAALEKVYGKGEYFGLSPAWPPQLPFSSDYFVCIILKRLEEAHHFINTGYCFPVKHVEISEPELTFYSHLFHILLMLCYRNPLYYSAWLPSVMFIARVFLAHY